MVVAFAGILVTVDVLVFVLVLDDIDELEHAVPAKASDAAAAGGATRW